MIIRMIDVHHVSVVAAAEVVNELKFDWDRVFHLEIGEKFA